MIRPLFLATFICVNAFAFIPSVPNLVKEVMEGRNTKPTFIGLRHRVRNGGEFMEVEEQVFNDRGRLSFAWRSRGQTFSGSRTKEGYALDSDHRVTSRSSAFLKYLLTSSAEDLQATLVNEGFVRQSQAQTYKPGSMTENDPATWNLKENFLIQPDVYLARLPDVAIMVNGQPGENGRAVYFDEGFRGIRRLEWREGGKTVAWNFQQFLPHKNMGNYPKIMSFEAEGQIQVETSLVSLLSSDAKKQPKPVRSNASVGGSDESLLSVLLSYR